MSKLRLASALLMALPLVSQAQTSSVNFANGSSVGLPLVFGVDGVGLHSANFVAQLFESTDGGASFGAVGTTSAFFTVASTSVRAGVWKSQSITLAGVNPGSTVSFKVAVWDSTLFANWDLSTAQPMPLPPNPFNPSPVGDIYQFGVTTSFAYNAPAAGDLNPADFNMVAFPGLTLSRYTFAGTPEPSTVALTAVGAAGLVFYCRRNIKARSVIRKARRAA